MGRLNGLYGGIFGTESWTLSQSYYYGYVDGTPDHHLELIEGLPIDRLDELDKIWIGKPQTVGNGSGNGESGPVDEPALIEAIIGGESYHPASLRLLGYWARKGVGYLDAEARLRTAFECVMPPDRDDRWRARYAEIPELLTFVYGREAAARDERIEFTIGAAVAEEGEPLQLRSLRCPELVALDIPPVDYLLGQVLSTTSRGMLVGPTVVGKTNLLMGMAAAIATGTAFLHRTAGRGANVLYLDGEMSLRLLQDRAIDVTRRIGAAPADLHLLSHARVEDLPPLNTLAGQKFVDWHIEQLGVEFLILDNIQCLTVGDMKETGGWAAILPWTRSLTNRGVGQLWGHHTGWNKEHGYGDSSREWGLDLVAIMHKLEYEPDNADLAFKLTFSKARERVRSNRADFDPIIVTLADDEWISEPCDGKGGKKPKAKDRALQLLSEAIMQEGEIPPACNHIPQGVPCVRRTLWRQYHKLGTIYDNANTESQAFHRACQKLIADGVIGTWQEWVWLMREQ
jgi:hypothetical protein